MRVLVVTVAWPTERYPTSGIFVVEQIASIRDAGIDVDVFHFAAGTSPASYVRARQEIARRLADSRYDIVHVHFGQAGWAMPRDRPPMVVTFHGSDLAGIVGRSGRYLPRSVLLRRMSRRTAQLADRVIVQSRRQGALLPSGVVPSVIPMGVDPTIFHRGSRDDARRALALPLDARIVLFSGSPDVPVKRFALAEKAVQALDGVDLITVSGQPRREVARYMQAADALVVTSLHESGPIMVKEALACGLPVVSVDVGDVADVVRNIGACEVVDSDTSEAIAAALSRVLVRRERVDAPDRVASFTAAATADRVIEVYRAALQD